MVEVEHELYFNSYFTFIRYNLRDRFLAMKEKNYRTQHSICKKVSLTPIY